MKKAGKTSMAMWFIGIAVVAILGLLIWFAFGTQQTTQPGVSGQVITTEEGGVIAPENLGNAATITVKTRDISQDDTPFITGVPVYVADSDGTYVVTGDEDSGDAITGAVVISTNPYTVGAFNNTYGSVEGMVSHLVDTSSEVAKVDVYTISASLDISVYDEDGVKISTTNKNFTMGEGETYTMEKIRVENDDSDSGFRFYGVYLNLGETTNISTVAFGSNLLESQGSMALVRTTADDYTWKLKDPVILYDSDSIELSSMQWTSRAGASYDPAGEAYTLYFVDGEYYFSTSTDSVKFGAENDDASPSDVGAADISVSGYIN